MVWGPARGVVRQSNSLHCYFSSLALPPCLFCYCVPRASSLVPLSHCFLTLHREPTAGLRSIAVVTRLYCTTRSNGSQKGSARRTLFRQLRFGKTLRDLHSLSQYPQYPACAFAVTNRHPRTTTRFPLHDKQTSLLSEVLSTLQPRFPASRQRKHGEPRRYPPPDCRQSHPYAIVAYVRQ